MNDANAAADRPRSGHIRLELDQQFRQQELSFQLASLSDDRFRVELVECALTRQLEITLLEREVHQFVGEGSIARQLFTYDLNRALEVVAHLMANDDPRGFCDSLALAFDVSEPGARIPLDCNPS